MALNHDSASSLGGASHAAKKNTVLISHGRPPWCAYEWALEYDADSRRYGIDGRLLSDAFVIGIGGGSSSGKVRATLSVACAHWTVRWQTFVARAILEAMGSIPSVVIVSQVR